MELQPALRLGWLNGWLLLAGFCAVFGALLLVFPRDVVARLYAFPSFTRTRLLIWLPGRVFNLGSLALIIFTPLKIGQPVCMLGVVVSALGFLGMVAALVNYRDTPLDRPVTSGLYSRAAEARYYDGHANSVHLHGILLRRDW